MSDLEKLISLCKCGVSLTVNEYRNNYQTVEKFIAEIRSFHEPDEIDDATEKKMIESSSVVRLDFYPHTPVGFITVWGSNVSEVVSEALKWAEANLR